MKLKISIVTTLVLILVMFMPSILHAQPDLGGDDVSDIVPVDGGLSLLVAAGVGYGVKKIRGARKQH